MTSAPVEIPKTQHAVQLTAPGALVLNESKSVPMPVGHQILARVEATGLCFSDLKLMKQFSEHARKSRIVEGISQDILDDTPSYVPDEKPTVPGHETVLRILAVGDDVKDHRPGERYLVQADYRPLRTAAGTNAAFGYNIEGGLQEYVILDERIIADTGNGGYFMVEVSEEKSASAICLVEPWACVESSYATADRRTPRPNGRLLIVADSGREIIGLRESFAPGASPSEVTLISGDASHEETLASLGIAVTTASDIGDIPDQHLDDIIYFGSDPVIIEKLSPKLAWEGIINIVTGGKRIGRPVEIGIGKVHYGKTRWIGTTTGNAADSYAMIPESGEIRDGDSILIVGAGGPMGQMHTIRDVCAGKNGTTLVATDTDDARLESLREKVRNAPAPTRVDFRIVNPVKDPLDGKFSYTAIMVPSPALVAASIPTSLPRSIVNIFAGIPAPTVQAMDLDTIIEKQIYIFGTSGSSMRDMAIVLEKLMNGTLDTNSSVDAVSGMAGAIDGIRAVEDRSLAGKIIVYPQLHDLPLTPLAELSRTHPAVASLLTNGQWTKPAEQTLLETPR